MCGISYISQLGSVKNTRLAARNPTLQRILTARSSNKKGINQQGNISNEFSGRHLDFVHSWLKYIREENIIRLGLKTYYDISLS